MLQPKPPRSDSPLSAHHGRSPTTGHTQSGHACGQSSCVLTHQELNRGNRGPAYRNPYKVPPVNSTPTRHRDVG
ncbi:unnamed protein product [Schistocephalus solidus]|uniref:Uncharacterized protein n=1 Tax=Schistocephalus solidus TaxID=70667 RepID=A0A183SIJ9_SCHSO|nr:unnamed protein product [Schistocephalus solidus]